MKKITTLLAIAGAAIILFMSGCDKTKEYGTDIPPFQAHFMNATLKTYYVKDDPDTKYKLPIGITTVSSTPTTVNVTITSNTAVEGTHYTVEKKSVTIAAGKVVDTLIIRGIFANYPIGRVDTLTLTINSGDAPASDYNRTTKLILRRYCNVVLNDFLGDYTRSADRQGTGAFTSNYTSKIVSATSTGPTTASLVIYNFGDPMFADPVYAPTDLAVNPGITVNLDWADDGNFKVTMPPQQIIAASTYGTAGLIKPAAAVGTFSSCDNTFTITYNFNVGASNYGAFTTIMKR